MGIKQTWVLTTRLFESLNYLVWESWCIWMTEQKMKRTGALFGGIPCSEQKVGGWRNFPTKEILWNKHTRRFGREEPSRKKAKQDTERFPRKIREWETGAKAGHLTSSAKVDAGPYLTQLVEISLVAPCWWVLPRCWWCHRPSRTKEIWGAQGSCWQTASHMPRCSVHGASKPLVLVCWEHFWFWCYPYPWNQLASYTWLISGTAYFTVRIVWEKLSSWR